MKWNFEKKLQLFSSNSSLNKNNFLKDKRIMFATNIASFNNVNLVDQSLGLYLNKWGADIAYMWCSAPGLLCHKFKFKNFNINEVALKIEKVCNSCLNYLPKDHLNFSRHYNLDSSKGSIDDLCDIDFNIIFKKNIYSTLIRMSADSQINPVFDINNEDFIKRCKMLSYNIYLSMILFRPSLVIIHHGIYIPQGITLEICKILSIPVLTYWSAYKANSFLFVEGDTYHKIMPNENFNCKIVNDYEKNLLLDYINSKEGSSNEWLSFHSKPYHLNLPNYYDLICTNVTWDAQIHFEKGIFNNMVEWVLHTIKFYIK
jgi:hypothetical protein